MNEKVHYEIRFVETDDGYRLEASGDKDALRRLGIGPNMVGKKRRPEGRRRQARRGPNQLRRGGGRRAAMARGNGGMNRGRHFAAQGRPGFGPRRFHGPRHQWQAMTGYGRYPGMEMAEEWEDPRTTWE